MIGIASQDTDVALVQTDHEFAGHIFEFVDELPPAGTEVAVIGYPVDESLSIADGTISGLDRIIHVRDWGRVTGAIQTDSAINPGIAAGRWWTCRDVSLVWPRPRTPRAKESRTQSAPQLPSLKSSNGFRAPSPPRCRDGGPGRARQRSRQKRRSPRASLWVARHIFRLTSTASISGATGSRTSSYHPIDGQRYHSRTFGKDCLPVTTST